MQILTVIPITNNPHIEELTYFSLKDIPLGSLVQVPMRSKEIPALIIQSDSANDMKATLRGGNFSLKRIGTAEARTIVPPNFVSTARAMAEYYATNIGAIISTMLPKAILTSGADMPKISQKKTRKTVSEVYALQTPFTDRITVYKNTVRESFAKKESVLLIVPSLASAEILSTQLSTGLKDRVYTLTSKHTKARQLKVFKQIHDSSKSVLLIATAKYALLFRNDISTIIIEDEASTNYETLKRPYMSLIKFIICFANISGLRLILGGTVLSSRTHKILATGKILELAPQSIRARSKVKVKILDSRTKKLDPNATAEEKQKNEKNKKPFTAISDDLHNIIKIALHEKKSIFILAPRRGLAPLTVCRDCKTPVLCETCDTPVTLRKKKNNEREFLCYKCGATQKTDTTCSYCNSWRLDTLGIGIEMIEDEITKAYSSVPLYKVDKQTTKTDTQVRNIVQEFKKNGGILLGTSMTLPFIEQVDVSAVASLDAMLSVPSFEIDERVFALLLKIKDITSHTLSIQTRMPERSVLIHAAAGDIATFVREELVLRKALKYPPYTVMVKITRTGSKRQIIEDFQNIMPSLEPYGPRVFKQFHQISPSKFALHALLRMPTSKYPDIKLTEILKSIQPLFEVRVDVG